MNAFEAAVAAVAAEGAAAPVEPGQVPLMNAGQAGTTIVVLTGTVRVEFSCVVVVTRETPVPVPAAVTLPLRLRSIQRLPLTTLQEGEQLTEQWPRQPCQGWRERSCWSSSCRVAWR